MLLEFKVRNFRSIREELTLSMLASGKISKKDHPDNVFEIGKHKAVKSLIMYGRNASGKSNILSALRALQYLIISSDSFKLGDDITAFEPFLFDEAYNTEPVGFEIDFISKNNIKYKFILEFNKYEILKEELYFYPKGIKSKLFARHKMRFSYGENFTGNRKNIENDILQNQLFLSKSATSKFEYLNDVYLYFKLSLLNIKNDSDNERDLVNSFGQLILEKKIYKDDMIKLLKIADTNIHGFELSEKYISASLDGGPVPFKHLNWGLKTKHNLFNKDSINGKIELDFSNESMGTKKLISIGSNVLNILTVGGVLIIDEFDKSMHPLLTRMLIQLFHNPKTNPKNAQLIFATHDSTLLDSELFRRDQIAFIEKEYQGDTQLYKLSDFKGVRKDIPIDKWYLSGKFGAIPVISDFEFED
jgi:AAA15 family ATPase/GTPase